MSFKAIENTLDGDNSFRGRSGLLPIRTRRPDELTPSLNAFIAASVSQGFPLVTDFNDPDAHKRAFSVPNPNRWVGNRKTTAMTRAAARR